MIFIKCKAVMMAEDQEMADLGINSEIEFEWTDYRFDLLQVESYNPGSTGETTTIRLKSGFDITTNIPLKRMDELINDPIYKRKIYE